MEASARCSSFIWNASSESTDTKQTIVLRMAGCTQKSRDRRYEAFSIDFRVLTTAFVCNDRPLTPQISIRIWKDGRPRVGILEQTAFNKRRLPIVPVSAHYFSRMAAGYPGLKFASKSVERLSCFHFSSSAVRSAATVAAFLTASLPSNRRSGGSLSPAICRITCAALAGSPFSLPALARINSASAPTVGLYSSRNSATIIEEPAQSVRNPPGSTIVVLIPSGPTSLASTSEKPSTAHFAD